MSRSTVRNQILLNDGLGNGLPIQTGTWISRAINIDEHRRLSITLGIGSATGAAGDLGGFTGQLFVQGTDELAQCNGATGTPEAGGTSRPGINSATGGRYWNTLASGIFNINNTTSSIQIQFTDGGVAFVRLAFNATGWYQAGPAVSWGSGTMNVYVTAKNS